MQTTHLIPKIESILRESPVGCDAVVCARFTSAFLHTARIRIRSSCRRRFLRTRRLHCFGRTVSDSPTNKNAIDIIIHCSLRGLCSSWRIRLQWATVPKFGRKMVPTSAGSLPGRFLEDVAIHFFLEERGIFCVFIMGQQKMYTIEMG
jgi:hypothetical protein